MNEMKSNIGYVDLWSMLKDCIFRLQERVKKEETLGIPSGIQPLDDMIDGFENGKVYIIGGRPCMGKEEFMLTMIRNITMREMPVLLFSTNHMKSDYVQRLLSIHCNIPTSHLQQGIWEVFEWKRLDEEIGSLIDAPLYIHDSLDLPLNELIVTALNCIKNTGTKIIFVDCLQMIDFTKEGENSSERIAKVMHSLKQLACQIDVPIVVGSMLGRGVEFREGLEGKQPLLIDLSNSSYIEEMADVILMAHRPEYFHIYMDDNGRDLHGLMIIYVMKNTLKPLGHIYLEYQQETGIIGQEKYAKICDSKFVSLEDLDTDNKAIDSLVKAFNLEEELPF